MCLNDYPLGFGSLKPSPLACNSIKLKLTQPYVELFIEFLKLNVEMSKYRIDLSYKTPIDTWDRCYIIVRHTSSQYQFTWLIKNTLGSTFFQ